MTQRMWMVGRGLLSEQQERIVTLPTEANHLVTGPPGSGKTVLLLHRADELLRNHHIFPRQLRVLVFTNVLRAYIGAGADALNLPFELIQSFYSWVFQLAEREGLPKSKAAKLEDKCKETLQAVVGHCETEQSVPLLDAVLVDEGQDLPLDAYRLLRKAARHVTVFADSTQTLFAEGADVMDAASALGISKGAITLTENLRSSVGVARLAAQFLSATERTSYLQGQLRHEVAGTTRIPLLLRTISEDDEWERIAEIVREEIARNSRVGILVVDNATVSRAYGALRAAGVPVQRVMAREPAQADFNELTPKILTVFSSKGLSFDTVLVPRITRQHYSHVPTTATQLLFVACTRALDWVCLSTVQGSETKELRLLDELISAGHLIEQHGPARRPSFRHDYLPEEDIPF
jgi:superfamily I DNA/RNA helicase